MQTPTEFEVQTLLHALPYDPIKAHEYYEKTKKLKGRKPGRIEEDEPGWDWRTMGNKSNKRVRSSADPRTGKHMQQIAREARAKKRKVIGEIIGRMEKKLKDVEAQIRKLEAEAASEDRKGAAKKERAAKEADKPKSAAEKAEAARESEKYRDKNQQKLKSKEKDSDKSGGSDKKESKARAEKIHKLKATATRFKGQIAIAKKKLAAL